MRTSTDSLGLTTTNNNNNITKNKFKIKNQYDHINLTSFTSFNVNTYLDQYDSNQLSSTNPTTNQTIKSSSSSSQPQPQPQAQSHSQTFSNSTNHSSSSSSSSSTCSSPPYSKQAPFNLFPIKPFNSTYNRPVLTHRWLIPYTPLITTLIISIIFYLGYIIGSASLFSPNQELSLIDLKPRLTSHNHQFRGWWFDRVTEIEQVVLIKVRDVKEIYGRPVEHFAHKADIIRLEALRDHGGIYLDFDVLGQEQSPSSSSEILGVCNAIILSKPFSPFISRWLSSYKSFDKTRWADHSASVPWLLAQKFPNEVTILGPRAFFYPLWHEDDLWKVHRSLDWDFDKSGQLAYHAWSSLSYKSELSKLNPERIHLTGGIEQGESSFTWFVRRYIHDEIRGKWNEGLKNGELKES
ncbi:uncharacterized protein MELLADRAFT_78967 [Melampsora larici-populina 98AG31]|uniref:Glycosyltransferase family 32 protein n=1 Tax=Melampsora larici-populina (strain 98AG31 / pathotype 3-4-7) TaxID=747676 RepID=F4S171_MELLP|nr:uncharacterized protein MELLADRAFT_78967 [Melampsora larici-populina 98AG31]EGG01515.1 hypothetical protein MELLADRAFT_78967 [Melampsora larici-populina 98AG31]